MIEGNRWIFRYVATTSPVRSMRTHVELFIDGEMGLCHIPDAEIESCSGVTEVECLQMQALPPGFVGRAAGGEGRVFSGTSASTPSRRSS
jgi:hypothetical protein